MEGELGLAAMAGAASANTNASAPNNTVRLHSSLPYLPLELKQQHQPTRNRAVVQE